MFCHVKEALWGFFVAIFRFQIYCSCCIHIIHLLSFSKKKTLKKVVKMSRFAIVRKSILISKRCTPKNIHMRSIRSTGVGNCLFLSARGWGREKICKSPGVCPGGGGMVRGQIETCINISLSCFSPLPPLFAPATQASRLHSLFLRLSLFLCCKFVDMTINLSLIV